MATTTLRSLEQKIRDASHEASILAEKMARPSPSSKTVAEYTSAKRELNRLRELLKEEQLRKKWADEAPDFGEKLRQDVLYTPEGQSRTAGTYIHLDFSPKSDRVVSRSGLSGTRVYTRTIAKNAVVGSGSELASADSVASWLYQGMIEVSGVLAAGPEVIRTGTGNNLTVPAMIDIGEASGEPVAEQGSIPLAEPTLGEVPTSAYGYKHSLIISRELVEDNVVDLNRLIGRHLGRLLGRYLGRDLVLGSAIDQPKGVHTAIPAGNKVQSVAGAAGLPSGTNAKNDFDRTYDVIAKVPAQYRDGAAWLMNPASVITLRKMKTANGLTLWPSSDPLFCGFPVFTDSWVTPLGIGTADGTCTLIFGDFSAYLIRLVKQVRVEWSTLVSNAWEKDLVAVRAILRADGQPLNANAFAGMSRNTT